MTPLFGLFNLFELKANNVIIQDINDFRILDGNISFLAIQVWNWCGMSTFSWFAYAESQGSFGCLATSNIWSQKNFHHLNLKGTSPIIKQFCSYQDSIANQADLFDCLLGNLLAITVGISCLIDISCDSISSNLLCWTRPQQHMTMVSHHQSV